jgi:hypothetical protein
LPRREFRAAYFSRPFRDHLARKAEQTSDPAIAEALRLLVKRWDEEREPVLEEERNFVAFYLKDRRVLAAVALNRGSAGRCR